MSILKETLISNSSIKISINKIPYIIWKMKGMIFDRDHLALTI